jgi:hypothetical protein
MVDLIVFEERESKYLIVVNNRIIVHRTLYKRGQCIKISNKENSLDNPPVIIKIFVTNIVFNVNSIELSTEVETSDNIKSIYIYLMMDLFLIEKIKYYLLIIIIM